MCLDQTLQIHALLKQRYCPYQLLEYDAGYDGCSVRCEGIYILVRNDYTYNSCVEYTINFNITGMLSSSFKSFSCSMPNCLLEQIAFECTFIKNDTDIKSNKTKNKENDLQKQQNIDVENISCFGAVIGLSCAVVGGVLGVLCFFVLVKQLRTHQRRFFPSKFIHPHTDDCCPVPMEREVTIAGQAAKGTITMEDKAIQVFYYKENHSSEPRSKENKLYQLCLMEDQLEAYGSVLLSSDFIQEG